MREEPQVNFYKKTVYKNIQTKNHQIFKNNKNAAQPQLPYLCLIFKQLPALICS